MKKITTKKETELLNLKAELVKYQLHGCKNLAQMVKNRIKELKI